MPRKTVVVVLRDEDGRNIDSVELVLPRERPVTLSEVIAMINAFFLILRRNHITEDTGTITITQDKPAVHSTFEVPF